MPEAVASAALWNALGGPPEKAPAPAGSEPNPFLSAEKNKSGLDAAVRDAESFGRTAGEGSSHNSLLAAAVRMKGDHGVSGDDLAPAVQEVHERQREADPNLRELPEHEVSSVASWTDTKVATKPMSPVGTIRSGADLRSLPKAVDWLVDGMVPSGRFVVLYGESGIGKSWVAQSLALHVPNGVDFLGRATKRGAVLWVGLEGTEDLPQRVPGLLAGIGPGADENGFYWLENAGLDLLSPRSVDAFTQMIKADISEPLALIVIDTWSLALGPSGSDSDNDDATHASRLIRSLITATGATVLVIHHSGHDKTRERGATALRANADVVWSVKKGKTAGGFVLSNEKMRSAPSALDAHLRLVVDDGTFRIESRNVVRKLTPEQAQIAAAARDVPGRNQTQIREVVGLPRATVSDHLNDLCDWGYLRSEKAGRSVIYHPGAKDIPTFRDVPNSIRDHEDNVPAASGGL
jgi:DNA-binding MarR family transcriptional regulator/energy-coupling factor transporter ATP-binding protein EcfA2